jgi:hypothetical protein
VAGRVVREYVGVGRAGELAAAEDAQRRAERRARAEASQAERMRLEAANARLEAFCKVVDAVAGLALLNAGYRPHRGEWRRHRE